VCMAIGHEDHGLTSATLAACDAVAYLPLLGRVGSLNVATATSIALYELRRQGWDSDAGRGVAGDFDADVVDEGDSVPEEVPR
jgi:tRNA (guanosine-2'-O-)-methyltransferase